MTRLMYDADDPYDIPSDVGMVGGYIDGINTWPQAWWDRFSRAVKVRFSAVGARWDAHVFDLEPGCIWPPENVIPLIVTARANGLWPAVYCNQNQHWAYVRRMFQMRGMEEPPYIVANYDGVAVVPPGAIGKQFKHPPQIGKHYDLSVIVDNWVPGQKEMDDMSWGERLTNAEGVTFKADQWLTWTNYYAAKAATDAAKAAADAETALQKVDDISVVLARILERLDGGTPDVEAAARRAKQLIGEDLVDEDTANG